MLIMVLVTCLSQKLEKYLTIIYDKMDHSKTASLCFASKTKSIDMFMQLPVAVIGMIAHGHGEVKFCTFLFGPLPW
jgi:hypothetical protein